MPGKEEIRERIVEAATALIEETGGDAERIGARARVQAQEEEAVLGLVEQQRHVVQQFEALAAGEEDFVHRLLPAGGVAAHQRERSDEAARAGDVVGCEEEVALGHGGHPVRGWRQCDQPLFRCARRQACGCAPRGGLPGEGAGARRVTRGAT